METVAMRYWDLNSGAAKLDLALDSLRAARVEASRSWQDTTSQKFDEAYLLPLDPRMRKTLDAVHRMSVLLTEARRACDE